MKSRPSILWIATLVLLPSHGLHSEGPADAGMGPMRDMTSLQLIQEMTIGWNLGNTLDATGGAGLAAETSWGNPRATPELMNTIRAAGFNTVRIPVTWQGHLGSAPGYAIDPGWLDRVQDVVDSAIRADLFVIVNLHHEDWLFPSEDNFDHARTQLLALWKQIATRFQVYNEKLIFEAMNEPRLKGTPDEWNGGTAEARRVINKLNAAFVETVRATKGNNLLRHLMIPTYAASADPRAHEGFTTPSDTRIIVSIHAYTPYRFALDGEGTPRWSPNVPSDRSEIDGLMTLISDRFLRQGIAALIGEYGARNKDNLADRVTWAEYYVRTAKNHGIPCIWWDNGAFAGPGENFGLLDRRTLKWKFPEIVAALKKGLEPSR